MSRQPSTNEADIKDRGRHSVLCLRDSAAETMAQLPFALAKGLAKRQRDKRFAAAIQSTGRAVSWQDARRLVSNQQGTLIEETSFSAGGPYRLWWTPDYVPDVCPYRCRFKDEPEFTRHFEKLLHDGQSDEAKRIEAAAHSEHAMFYEWCSSRYTNPESGTALLVNTAELDLRE